jgi:ribonuclease-3
MEWEQLEKCLGYTFKDKSYLRAAVTHPSFLQDKASKGKPIKSHYQRLEFLGDNVLGCIVADHLFRMYPRRDEGFLSKAQSLLARKDFLVEMARSLGVPIHVKAGSLELKQLSDSIVEDVFEALVGAIYLDAGLETTYRLVVSWMGNVKMHLNTRMVKDNPKGRLQEFVGADAIELVYKCREMEKRQVDWRFESELYFRSKRYGVGRGKTKRQAENEAAETALKLLKKEIASTKTNEV